MNPLDWQVEDHRDEVLHLLVACGVVVTMDHEWRVITPVLTEKGRKGKERGQTNGTLVQPSRTLAVPLTTDWEMFFMDVEEG